MNKDIACQRERTVPPRPWRRATADGEQGDDGSRSATVESARTEPGSAADPDTRDPQLVGGIPQAAPTSASWRPRVFRPRSLRRSHG